MRRLLVLMAIASAGCAQRTVTPTPAWHAQAVLDRESPARVILQPRMGDRFGICATMSLRLDDMRSTLPAVEPSKGPAPTAIDTHFTFATLKQVDRVGPEGIEMRWWTGPLFMDFTAEGIEEGKGTLELDFGFPPAVVRYSPRYERLFPEEKTEVVDDQREPDEWKLSFPPSFYSDFDYPRGSIEPGYEWTEKRSFAQLSWDKALREHTTVEIEWTFEGTERTADGDYYHFTSRGEMTRTTNAPGFSGEFVGEQRGVIRIAAKDGAQAQSAYSLIGTMFVESKEKSESGELGRLDSRVTAASAHSTVLLGDRRFSLASTQLGPDALNPCIRRGPATPQDEPLHRTASAH